MKKVFVAAGFIVAALVTAASAAGLWPNMPIVGGASYCSSFNVSGVPGTTGACTNTVPAGPTAVTGNEQIPADTRLANGQSPQTVLLSMRAIGAAPIGFNTCAAAACGSFTVGDNSGGVFLSYSTTIDSATVVTPANPMDGQQFTVGADHTITTLTMTANTGQSFAVTAPAVLTASATAPQGYKFMYHAATAKWYKVQ